MQIVEPNGLCSHVRCVVFSSESNGRQIAKSSLFSNSVVKDFDISGDLTARMFAGGETTVIHKFVLQ